jgi:hypothetical protein
MLTFVGAVALTCMVVCYALEARSPWFIFAFGLACLCASAYGWLAGTWPFGIMECLWGLLALRRWALVVAGGPTHPRTYRPSPGGLKTWR